MMFHVVLRAYRCFRGSVSVLSLESVYCCAADDVDISAAVARVSFVVSLSSSLLLVPLIWLIDVETLGGCCGGARSPE